MGNIYQQVLTLLTTSPGNLAYHLVLAFSIAGAIQAASNLWRHSEFPQGRRMVIGLGLLLGTRLILFVGAGLAYQDLIDLHTLLPITDRAVSTLSLLLIIWLWAFPEPLRLADAASGLLGLLILAAFALNGVWWSTLSAGSAFNASLPDYGWETLALLLLVLGIIAIIIRRPNGWGYGLAMMGIASMGHLTHLMFPILDSDLPGAVRLAQLASYPILLALPHRFDTPAEKAPAPVSQVTFQERRRYGVEPGIFQSILSLTTESSQPEMCKDITRTVAEALLADICLAIHPSGSDGQFFIQCGYDLIREETLASMSLDNSQVPLLATAMQRVRPLRLPASSTSRDLTSLGQILGLGRTGHLLAAFVPSTGGNTPLMGIVLLSPYSDKRWSRNDQAYLTNITNSLAPILQQTQQAAAIQKELASIKHNLQAFQTLLEDTQNENTGLRTELSNINKQAIQEQKRDMAALIAAQQESQDRITRLKIENQRLGELIESITSEDASQSPDIEQLQEELRLTLEEIARLQNQIPAMEQKMTALRTTSSTDGLSDGQLAVFTSIVQELRQPMSSIIGYTELLLGESMGILGALQRKFMERVRAATERMNLLLDDLSQIATLDRGDLELSQEAVDLNGVIDEAIANTRTQLQERGIVLRVDLPDEMPQLHADRDALQQILIQLLQNAGTASPINGEIFLRASTYNTGDDQDFVLMQVADQGGGISTDDLPRVFSRLYRADNPLIQGLGDTGVGLSIAKTLVEAHNGRIWVDTEMDKGSTFSLLIPLARGSTPVDGEEDISL
ncbi:MAG: hypothetical protein KJ638_09665 [Chloroflexi bacterium]|nr:hypothetical protein [Chloroflexota bacterium]